MIFDRKPVVRFTSAARTAAAPGDTVAMPVRDALQALPVQDENRAGYERTVDGRVIPQAAIPSFRRGIRGQRA
nr:hypothetical protein [Streptomyces sp. S1D4-11]